MGLVKLFGQTIPVAAPPPGPEETPEPVDDGGGGGVDGMTESSGELQDLTIPKIERGLKEESPAADKKKSDKIIPCPRCKSTATKFCYYNNYNVNQPRHFCKNCQRYWTAGGAMRNVPVGAGRRKTKPSAVTASQPTVLRFSSDYSPPLPSPPHSSGSSTENQAKRSHLSENPLPHSSNPFSVAVPFHPAIWGYASPNQEKRSREDKLGEEKSNCRLWIPRTLRMDNPDEAAKSSIWAMAGGIRAGDAFLHANPAALSRSLNFQESS